MYLDKEAPTHARARMWASEDNFQRHFSLSSVQALGTRSSGLVASAIAHRAIPGPHLTTFQESQVSNSSRNFYNLILQHNIIDGVHVACMWITSFTFLSFY